MTELNPELIDLDKEMKRLENDRLHIGKIEIALQDVATFRQLIQNAVDNPEEVTQLFEFAIKVSENTLDSRWNMPYSTLFGKLMMEVRFGVCKFVTDMNNEAIKNAFELALAKKIREDKEGIKICAHYFYYSEGMILNAPELYIAVKAHYPDHNILKKFEKLEAMKKVIAFVGDVDI
jgi:hypothetical protein